MKRVSDYIQQHPNFTEQQKQELHTNLSHSKYAKLAGLLGILVSWSIAAFFIESVLIGGGIIFTIIKGLEWRYFLPEIVFVGANFFSKLYFIRWYMKKEISLRHAIYGAIPTIGPGVLFVAILNDNRLLLKAFSGYMRYRKNIIFKSLRKILHK